MPASYSSRQIKRWIKTGRRPVPEAAIPFLFTEEQIVAFTGNLVVDTTEMAADAAVEALQEAVVTARAEVMSRETSRSGGIAPLCRMFVDGVPDAPLSAIQPDSTIVLLWSYLPEVARRTFEALEQRSPRLTGRYVEGLMAFIDGEPSGFQAITFDTREVRLVATVPYARRLEVGKTNSGRYWVHRVAQFIVEETAIIAKHKFGDLAKVRFEYVDLSSAWALSSRGMHARHFEGGNWRRNSSPRMRAGMIETHVRYPSILIEPQ